MLRAIWRERSAMLRLALIPMLLVLLMACGDRPTTVTTETSRETVCNLIGDVDASGIYRPPTYSGRNDTPETRAYVRRQIAKGAELGCWPGEA